MIKLEDEETNGSIIRISFASCWMSNLADVQIIAFGRVGRGLYSFFRKRFEGPKLAAAILRLSYYLRRTRVSMVAPACKRLEGNSFRGGCGRSG